MIPANQNVSYNNKIMTALHEMLDIETTDTINDIRKLYTPNEILETVLNYEGIQGYTDIILSWIKEIYGIDLSELED